MNTQNKAKMFLEGLHSNQTKATFEQLQSLIELLENKNDPDPIEIRLVQSIYSFIENLNILESNIKSYSKESSNLLGNKLTNLYENISDKWDIYRD